jgi:hypothetical protein
MAWRASWCLVRWSLAAPAPLGCLPLTAIPKLFTADVLDVRVAGECKLLLLVAYSCKTADDCCAVCTPPPTRHHLSVADDAPAQERHLVIVIHNHT